MTVFLQERDPKRLLEPIISVMTTKGAARLMADARWPSFPDRG